MQEQADRTGWNDIRRQNPRDALARRTPTRTPSKARIPTPTRSDLVLLTTVCIALVTGITYGLQKRLLHAYETPEAITVTPAKSGSQGGRFGDRDAAERTQTTGIATARPSQERSPLRGEPTASSIANLRRISNSYAAGNARCIDGKPFVIHHRNGTTEIEQVNTARCEVVSGK